MTTLSPAAQAVWSAFLNHSEWEVTTAEFCGVAAALRAVAEILREAYANERYPDHPDNFLFAIASELEGAR
jgi:hypothetical protein